MDEQKVNMFRPGISCAYRTEKVGNEICRKCCHILKRNDLKTRHESCRHLVRLRTIMADTSLNDNKVLSPFIKIMLH